jgi:GNAT superfamily N-acetyltransferase
MEPEVFAVRAASPDDVGQVNAMMRSLAAFEGYLDCFRVATQDLRERAFGANPQCSILVADGRDGMLAGYAVYLVQPFAYDLRPSVTLKELFVDSDHRGRGVAIALLERLRQDANRLGAGRILWLVLPSNEAAKRLYQRFGGSPDAHWEHWQLELVGGTRGVRS